MCDTELSRRDFLRIGAAAGLAIGCGELGLADQPRAPGDRLRVGFVGTGGRGTVLLKEALALGSVDVPAVCDINADNLSRAIGLAEETLKCRPDGYSSGDKDYLNLLARTDLDAVVIATPCYLHAPMYLDAFSAGKHFYGEKPMCLSVNEGNDLLKAQARNPGIVAQIGFQRRANARYIESVSQIRAGRIGELIEGRAAWDNSRRPPNTWLGLRKYSGDWMLEQACHTWDVFNWTLGATPVRAFGTGRRDVVADSGRDVTDYYTAIVQWPNGFDLTFHHSMVCPDDDAFTGVYERVVGSLAGCELSAGRFTYRDGIPKYRQVGRDVNDTRELLRDFFQCVRNGSAPMSGVGTAFDAVVAGLLVRTAVDRNGLATWDEVSAKGGGGS